MSHFNAGVWRESATGLFSRPTGNSRKAMAVSLGQMIHKKTVRKAMPQFNKLMLSAITMMWSDFSSTQLKSFHKALILNEWS